MIPVSGVTFDSNKVIFELEPHPGWLGSYSTFSWSASTATAGGSTPFWSHTLESDIMGDLVITFFETRGSAELLLGGDGSPRLGIMAGDSLNGLCWIGNRSLVEMTNTEQPHC